ncbi:MAG TPA: hypothetical protein VM734_20050 [Kofleriaceae bacterium]|jgi:hypothetical protein|nr:hypothetical protein [Kofleriaceae bacterium]
MAPVHSTAPRTDLLIANASSSAVDLARWGLGLALALLVIGSVALVVMLVRRRRRPAPSPIPLPRETPAPPRRRAPPVRTAPARPAVGFAGGGLAVATSGLVCPTCRTEYSGMIYCPRDARRLVAPEEMLAGARSAGGMCGSCGRAFEPGLRRCPHDGADIIPAALYLATRRRRDAAPTGVMAKVCPVCRDKADLSSRFCGRDGHELVVVN